MGEKKVSKLSSKQFFLIVSAIVLLGTGLLFSFAFSKKEIVASVEGETITKDDLYNLLVEQNGAEALNSLIVNKVIENEAKKEDIKISDKELDEELTNYIETLGGEELFNASLEQSGMKIDSIKENIKQYLTIKKLVEPRIEVTDEEVETFFEENKDEFNEEEQVKASHILVEDEKTAKAVDEKIAAGEDFAELAAEYSKDTANAESGGDLGYFSKGKMLEEFDNMAFSMEIDEISDPVKTESGYHIIKLTDKKEAKEAVFDEHKDEIKETLFEEKLKTEYPTWLEEKKADYKISNSLANA